MLCLQRYILILGCIFTYCSCINLFHKKESDTLVLIHIVFRHGNRTGQKNELYPKDPYLNYSYYPVGNGQLTNVGKRKEYSIGQALRQRYGKFLGNDYYPEVLEAISTDYNRTKMSLELVLASLYPPRGSQIWNLLNLFWQPIPYNFVPTNVDRVLIGVNCPNYVKKFKELTASPKYQAIFAQNKEIFDYISNSTGLNVTTFQQVYNLYFGLSTEEEYGLKLPKWTKQVWPEKIVNLSIQEYYVETGTTDLKKMASGYHVEKILADTQAKIKNINETHGRKIILYSAHENNLAELLVYLDIFKPHIPTYGSYIVLEVHNINNTYGFKIFYQNYSTRHGEILKLPTCEEFCPLDKFISIVREYLPSEDLCGN